MHKYTTGYLLGASATYGVEAKNVINKAFALGYNGGWFFYPFSLNCISNHMLSCYVYKHLTANFRSVAAVTLGDEEKKIEFAHEHKVSGDLALKALASHCLKDAQTSIALGST